jgi:predicted site-specific integrase-resolvase
VEQEQEEPLLTLQEAATVLGIGAEQVRRYARAGSLRTGAPAATPGRT